MKLVEYQISRMQYTHTHTHTHTSMYMAQGEGRSRMYILQKKMDSIHLSIHLSIYSRLFEATFGTEVSLLHKINIASAKL